MAGTDGGIQWKHECMAAGYVAGTDPAPLMTFSVPVGGPLSYLRAEGARLLYFLKKVALWVLTACEPRGTDSDGAFLTAGEIGVLTARVGVLTCG